MKRALFAFVFATIILHAGDDPVVEAAKRGTRVAVRKTKSGTKETVHAVKYAATSAAEKVAGDKTKPSSSDIAEARKRGMVWADHQTWLYHKDGPKYGRTMTGEFWTEQQAQIAGYKLSPTAKP